MGFGAIDDLRSEFPDRVYNCGVMEQGTVGIAAGMAMTGLIPIFYTIVNFLAFRSIEQIRNDVILQNLNVKFIGTGAEDYFEFLGPSHTCGSQDVEIMKLVGVDVFNPYPLGDELAVPFDYLVNEWINRPWATYIRV